MGIIRSALCYHAAAQHIRAELLLRRHPHVRYLAR